MTNGSVVFLAISPTKREPMQEVSEVMAEAGRGLVGDRYHSGNGSYSKNQIGRRQVTLINSRFFPGTSFSYLDCRRNIVTNGIELMRLINNEFQADEAILRGVKYCDPCRIPDRLSGIPANFADEFHDRGGLVAEVMKDGLIRVGGKIILLSK